ncbi:1583_t:CDS:2, partial [Scutellospora calospora]
MYSLNNLKIEEIINEATDNFNGRPMKFNDGQVDIWSDFYRQDIYSMLTDINNKSIDFW